MTRPTSTPSARLAAAAAALLAAVSPLAGCVQPDPSAPVPVETRAMLPGRWELSGAWYVWAEPDRHMRHVEPGRLVPGRWAWRGGRYVWEPARVVTGP